MTTVNIAFNKEARVAELTREIGNITNELRELNTKRNELADERAQLLQSSTFEQTWTEHSIHYRRKAGSEIVNVGRMAMELGLPVAPFKEWVKTTYPSHYPSRAN